MTLKIFTALIILAVLSTSVDGRARLKNILKISKENDPHEFFLSHRTCFVFMIGTDWVKDSIDKAI